RSKDASLGSESHAVAQLVSVVTGPNPIISSKGVWPADWVLSVPFYLVLVFLLLVANVVLTIRPGVVTHDSKEFADAMENIWYPLVLAKQNTPRAAKRFINRVRYLAMRQSGFQEKASWWERALFQQRLREPSKPKSWQAIAEPVLVALAAIEQMQSDWVYNETAFKSVLSDDALTELTTNYPANVAEACELLKKARTKHKDEFSKPKYVEARANWESLEIYRATFLLIWPQLSAAERN